ncbi:Outer-membrane lipoprotein LolB [Gammaproteobacteria bacterium]
MVLKIYTKKIVFPVLLTLVLLSGCANTRETLNPESESRWQTRQRVLSTLRNWEFNGRIAIQREEEGWFASLIWKQQDSTYHLQVSGPMGQGAARLEGNINGVTLTRSDKTIYQATRPEELLMTHFGWRIPVSGLHYWILGLPAPEELDLQELDNAGHLIRLRQDGWDIHFDRYREINSIELPGHLILERPPLTVRIIVENWNLT